MNRWTKAGIAVLVIAIGVLLFDANRRSAEEQAWAGLASARASALGVDELEAARESAKGSSAEPWISFYLAMQLYGQGDLADIGRAGEVARLSIEAHPDHATTPMLRKLLEVLETYSGAASS